jgi:chitosanase
MITTQRINKIRQIIRYFETSKISGANYGAMAMFNDGPGGRKQLTYGASQATEFGNLKTLIKMYVNEKGKYAHALSPFLSRIGDLQQPSLCENALFVQRLKDAAADPIMQQVQDRFFMIYYFNPARQWFERNKFTLPLSLLVIYDSHVHSGSILKFLRNAFAEKVPFDGGDEKAWITAYVKQRDHWLETHSRKILQNTDYRTDSFIYAIAHDNWMLDEPFQVVNFRDANEKTEPRILATIP